MPDCDGAGMAKRSYPTSEVRGGGREEIPSIGGQGRRPGGDTPCPKPEARGGGREDQPHAVAERAQEGIEELSHVEGQEGLR